MHEKDGILKHTLVTIMHVVPRTVILALLAKPINSD